MENSLASPKTQKVGRNIPHWERGCGGSRSVWDVPFQGRSPIHHGSAEGRVCGLASAVGWRANLRAIVMSAPFATDLLRGEAALEPAPGWRAIPVPGHTAGSVIFLLEETFLFTGDSLAWDFAAERLTAFREFCNSWPAQRKSLQNLLGYSFRWVLAGHGGSWQLPPEQMRASLEALVQWMDTVS